MSAELKRWETTLADTDGAPIASATVNVYFEGATASGSHTIVAGGEIVNVYDPGDLRAGDTLEVFDSSGWGTGVHVTVTSFVSNTAITMGSTGDPVIVSAGDRFIIIGRSSGDVRPRIYTADGEASIIQTLTGGYTTDGSKTSDANGLVAFYVKSPFDAVVTGSGVTTQLIPEQDGGRASKEHDSFALGVSFDDTEATGARNSIAMQDAFTRTSRSADRVGRIAAPRGVAYLSDQIQMDAGAAANPDGGRFILEGDPYTEFKLDSAYTDTKVFYISGAYRHDTCVFKHVTFNGNSVASINAMLDMAAGAREVIIEDCWFKDITAGCIKLGLTGGTAATLIEHFHVVRNHFDGCGGNIVSIVDCRYGEISGNTFGDMAASSTCIFVEPGASGDFARNVVIDRNHLYETGGAAWAGIAYTGQAATTTDDTVDESFAVKITDNSVVGATNSGLYVTGCHNLHVTDNDVLQFKGTVNAGVYLGSCRNSAVRGNTVDGQSTGDNGIDIAASKHVVVSDNVVFNCDESGIVVSGACEYVQVKGNDCHENNTADAVSTFGGIHVSGAAVGTKITDNMCIENNTNNGHGIYVPGGSNALIDSNLCLSNGTAQIDSTGSTNTTTGTNKTS